MARRSKKAARRFSKRRGSRRMRGGSRRRMRGGWRVLSGAALNDMSMKGPMNMSLRQGEEYGVLHEGQHGGAHGVGAPAFQSDTLPSSMITAARVGPTLQAFSEIQGMKDQGGGGRRRRRRSQYGGDGENMGPGGEEVNENNSSMAGGRRRRKSRKSRKTRRRRRQGGGSFQPADVSSPTMLLSGNSARHAEGAMNPEWQLAKNPSAFAPM
jgi:hypothetical protein